MEFLNSPSKCCCLFTNSMTCNKGSLSCVVLRQHEISVYHHILITEKVENTAEIRLKFSLTAPKRTFTKLTLTFKG